MNRGLEHRVIFRTENDAGAFLELVSDLRERWQVRCHAACLMSNHYHLLLEDTQGNLSRAMRHLDGVFTQRFNRRHNRDGPLMRGRYHSQLVQDDAYILEVVRYIHMNPLEAGLVTRASQYRWSSHRWYLAPKAPEWLQRDVVFDHFAGAADADRSSAFDAFVHARAAETVRSDLTSEPWQPVLGSRSFVDTWRKRIRKSPKQRAREVPQARRLTAMTVEQVIRVASGVFRCPAAQLLDGSRGIRRRERELTLLACRQFCAATNADLGARFGISASTVSTAARRTRADIVHDTVVDTRYRQLVDALRSKPRVTHRTSARIHYT